MIRTSILRRHYAITASLVLFFIVTGFVLSHFAVRYFAQRPDFGFPRFPFRAQLLDEKGASLTGGKALPIDWEAIRKPEAPDEFVPLPAGQASKDRRPPGPPPGLIRLPGEKVQYLYLSPRLEAGIPPPVPPGPPLLFFIGTFGSLICAVIIGIGFAIFLLSRSVSEKVALVDDVMLQLKKGNLKARFPVQQADELGQAMERFNAMADEIETLVERLRTTERSRMALLQDLTHDLRTPIASLKNLLSTLQKPALAADAHAELLALAQRETEYFERLVEDLLVLAQVSEPQYKASSDRVDLKVLLDDEADSVALGEGPKTILVEGENLTVAGDPHLLRRLVRNALENAYTFAQDEVRASVQRHGTELQITIVDDGPGFTAEGLRDFGERRASRVLRRTAEGRLSVGLGSVIMRTVAELHRGRLRAYNRGDAQGAAVEITLPIS